LCALSGNGVLVEAALGTDDTVNEVGINLMPLAGAVNNNVKVLPDQDNTCGLRWRRNWFWTR